MPSKSRRGAGDYPVGYCKPPTGSQFKPGQSGNPGGRPGTKPLPPPPKEGELSGLDAAILRAMRGKVTVKAGVKRRRVQAEDALAGSLVARAVEGDMRATRVLLELHRAAEAREAQVAAMRDREASVSVTLALTKLIFEGAECGDCGAISYPLAAGGKPAAETNATLPEAAAGALAAGEASPCEGEAECVLAKTELEGNVSESIAPPPPPSPSPVSQLPIEAKGVPWPPVAKRRRRGEPLIPNPAPIIGSGLGLSGTGRAPP